jgi:hypothetical protein
MQLNSVYLYPNKIDVFTNTLASWQLERYRRVYNRNLKIYRSVDNRIDLQVRNSDQKSADITSTVLVFNIIAREANDLVITKDCVTVSATTGKVHVTISRSDLLDLEPGFYNYSIVQEVRETISATEYRVTSRTPMYTDSQYGVVGVIEVSGDTGSVAEQSLNVSTFAYINPATTGYQDPKYYISSLIDCKGQIATPQSLHSFQFYSTGYTGTVIIQGSIDEGATPKTWVDISTQTVTNSNLKYSNIVGKWNFFRIKHLPTTGTVDKVLYR